MFPHFVVEDDQTHRIVLTRSQVGQRRGEKLRILKLVNRTGAETHRGACIQKYHQMRIGLAEISLDIGSVGASINIPVDESRVIALRVRSVFRELLAETEERGTMQAIEKAMHGRTRDEFKVRQTRQYLRIEELPWRS